MTRVLVAAAVFLAAASLRAANDPDADAERRPLHVEVRDGPAAVHLRIRLPADVDPGSVEILLSGDAVTILAREVTTGRRAYEQRVQIPGAPVRETGVTADSEGIEWLRVTLPRQAGPHPVSGPLR